MKKKVFFIISHLRAGGSEKVFWLLSKYFDKSLFDVSLVLLDSRNPFFSIDIKDVNVVHLNTIKASASFFKLYKLLKAEKPDAVFTTGSHINILISIISSFVYIPVLIGRESNLMELMAKLGNLKDRFWDLFVKQTFKKFNYAVCQSIEIKYSLANYYGVANHKLVVIPNPVMHSDLVPEKKEADQKKLIIVARLATEKGISRFLQILKQLPNQYVLTIAGAGPLESEIRKEIQILQLEERIELKGLVKDITRLIANHDLMVLPSFTEGFPNVVLESLSVGVPVVAFRVSGIQEILRNNFNGFIVNQGDLKSFEKNVIKACNTDWEHEAIKIDVDKRFGIDRVVRKYESLLVSHV